MRFLLWSITGGLVLLLGLTLPVADAAALEVVEGMEAGGAVTLEADQLSLDESTSTYQATGQVRLTKGVVTLEADQLQWNSATGTATARGGVRLAEPQGVLEGEALTVDLESGSGRLEQGRVTLRDSNFHIAGEDIERLGEDTYRIRRGTFTTCEGAVPSWKFGAGEFNVTLEGYARAKHLLLYLRDIPVLYVPYLIYPAKQERQSGFLLPRYGYSQKRGTSLSLAYYKTFGPHRDATFYLDYLSDLGVGKGLEFRYLQGDEGAGTLYGYHVNGLKGEKARYALEWKHSGPLPGEGWFSADVEHVSSRDYFMDFGEEAEEYTRDQAQSVVYASRHWAKLNLAGQFKYTKDLEQGSDQTLQRLPEVRLVQVRRRLGETPLYLQFDGASTYFWREEGERGERLDLRPALSAVFRPGRVLEFVPEVGYRERVYWASSGFERKGLPDVSARLSSRLSRVYAPEWKTVKRLQHSVEPDVLYLYIPSSDQSRLPQFDTVDDIASENTISYGITNRLTARYEDPDGAPRYHEVFYLRLSQDYDLRESRRNLLNPQDNLRPFSALRGELILRPNRWSFLDLDGRFNPYSENSGFTDMNARGKLQDGAGNALSLEYRYREKDLEYLGGKLELTWLQPLYLGLRHRFNLEERRRLENVVDLEFRAQCWSVRLSIRDRLEDREYLVSFALAGLGKVARFGGTLSQGDEEGLE
ncbi:MAG: hypothetical protein C0617_10725 [Desulfuromonas sp.]|uniref:LPS-assembly protein LptD n=1 Tax=Desulfuromonas sp. TaxID=892 RepID=UPI000CAD6DCD|nr:LPS assembly protein LptD [Desulfuromonas sp.]PLX83605.1 MAG: hypothetical protein C0617_10725 [Desulfuromonas sp.]